MEDLVSCYLYGTTILVLACIAISCILCLIFQVKKGGK